MNDLVQCFVYTQKESSGMIIPLNAIVSANLFLKTHENKRILCILNSSSLNTLLHTCFRKEFYGVNSAATNHQLPEQSK